MNVAVIAHHSGIAVAGTHPRVQEQGNAEVEGQVVQTPDDGTGSSQTAGAETPCVVQMTVRWKDSSYY